MNKTLALSLALMLGATAAFARGSHHVSPDLSGKSVKDLIALVSGNGDVEVRTTAAYALMEQKETSAFIPLLAALSDASSPERLRSAVAYDIYKFEDKRAVLVLLHTLQEPSLRYESMNSLGELKAADAVEPIVDIVLGHVMHGDDVAGEDFVDHNAVIVEGVEALGKIGEVAGLRGVMPVLAQDEYYRRQVAVEAIDKICMTKGAPKILLTDLVKPLMTNLLDPKNEANSNVRLEAVFSLSHLKDKSTAPALKEACESDEDARVRYASRDALQGMGAGSCDAFKPIRKFLPPELRDSGR